MQGRNKIWIILILCLGMVGKGFAQQEKLDKYKEDAGLLINYWQVYVNILGDSTEAMDDKERIVSESYLRVIRDSKVQIEDDLDANRLVPYYKDAQAYLKDITFFYRQVQFNYTVESIEPLVNDQGEYSLIVKTQRNLQGILVKDRQAVEDTKTVYFEMTVNQSDETVKIVSVYSTKLNEDEELYKWWFALSPNWKTILGSHTFLADSSKLADLQPFVAPDSSAVAEQVPAPATDSLSTQPVDSSAVAITKADYINAIKRAVSTEALDLSDHMELYDFDPLNKLTNLRTLNLSHTFIDTLYMVRNMTQLERLDISYTRVRDLGNLRYLASLKELSAQYSPIENALTLSRLRGIQRLNLAYTPFDSLNILKYNNHLKVLDLSGTANYDLSPLAEVHSLTELHLESDSLVDFQQLAQFKKLEKLELTNTNIADLSVLKPLTQLQVLFIKNTRVADLAPLQELPSLKTVYCDNSGVDINHAQKFMREKAGTLVVADSKMLQQWWQTLPSAWAEVFHAMLPDSLQEPTGEWLHQTVFGVTDLAVNAKDIMDLEPLRMLVNLKKLDISHTGVYRLDPLKDLVSLQELNLSDTKVTSLSALKSLGQLEKIDFSGTPIATITDLKSLHQLKQINGDGTQVGDLKALDSLKQLSKIHFDDTRVEDQDVKEFLQVHPKAMVIYKTKALKQWWSGMSRAWKSAFDKNTGLGLLPTSEQLHELILSDQIDLSNMPDVQRLDALAPFVNLKRLVARNTRLMDISPLAKHPGLTYLDISNNPIENIETVSQLQHLNVLLLENAQVPLFDPIATLPQLKQLNIAGTRIKRIHGVEMLKSLEDFSFYNTKIRGISRLADCPNLKKISCYNSKVRSSDIEKLKAKHATLSVNYY